VDFRERIRVNGEMVSEQYVINFVKQHRTFFEPLHPSFFELTTAMAFKYFAEQQVDVAVVEVGLGGRLDCTNIISPEVCVITNISFDHVAFLGHTLAKIAGEKAGIIKAHTPVVIGEVVKETRPVFQAKAQEMSAPIFFAEEEMEVIKHRFSQKGGINYQTAKYGKVYGELGGYCQQKNANTILCAISRLKERGFHISDEEVKEGFAHVCEMTGLMGRWQTLQTSPRVVCDTGHNVGGFRWITKQLNKVHAPMRIVFGMVNDKDISGVLSMMPQRATYYFCQASVKRALPHEDIKRKAEAYGLIGKSYSTVIQAYQAALADAQPDDFIYVGGSSFVVADLFSGF
jgi:dihydrofolate synthase/folylpolyglutamate synthase